jgi:hypothetical protein
MGFVRKMPEMTVEPALGLLEPCRNASLLAGAFACRARGTAPRTISIWNCHFGRMSIAWLFELLHTAPAATDERKFAISVEHRKNILASQKLSD